MSSLSRKILSPAREQNCELQDNFREAASSASNETSKYNEMEIDQNDEKALDLFMNRKQAPRRTLADIMMKIEGD